MKTPLCVAAIAALLLTAGLGRAEVMVKFQEMDQSLNLKIYHPFAPFGQRLQVGSLSVKVDLLNDEPAIETSVFCIDLRQKASKGWKGYELDALEAAPNDGGSPYSPMGPTKANAIRELWADHAADVVSNQTAAAFQAALWEIIYENSNTAWWQNPWSTAWGNFRVADAGVSSLADAWLADLGDGSDLASSLVALTAHVKTNQWQDFLFVMPGGSRPPVPEPLTMVTLAAALSGLGLYVRRRTAA